MENKKWYNLTVSEIYKKLNTSDSGLSLEEVSKRTIKYGKNTLPKKKNKSIFRIFIDEFKDPIILLLLVAIIASFVVNETLDAYAILFIVMVDVIMGTYQEQKANNSVESLLKLITVESKVIRNGKIQIVNSEDLTVGDIVKIEPGSKISADLRIIEAQNFMVDESILTGESINVPKDNVVINGGNISISEQSNMLFSGTTVVSGRAIAIVVAVGLNTEIGHIAETIRKTKDEKSPLAIRVEEFSKKISLIVLFVAIIISILLIFKGYSYSTIFLLIVSLSVSAMPEGLPLALTMALTIASTKMSKKNVIVKKLNSVEALGSCTVIASDKTGTLTVNEQTAKKIILPNGNNYNITGTGYEIEGHVIGDNLSYANELALYGIINNEASIVGDKRTGDSIDIAFLVLGKKLFVDKKNIKVIDAIPYESENKYSAVFYEKDGVKYCTVKGSLEKVMSFCNKANLISKLNKDKLLEQNEDLARDGYRVIAIANGKVKDDCSYKEEDIKNLTFIGMVGFIDPIRKDVVDSIEMCNDAGIKVLMITGDHPLTAFSIARELNLTNNYDEVTSGNEVDEYLKKGNHQFDEFVSKKTIFTRVTPLQKLEIIESLKRQGEFVAVTGDGVNDAPAIKSANIGIAMGSGTDIAKETAKMIIIDDSFRSIVSGIREGRVAYANIRKIIYFLISCGLAEVLFFCLAIVFNLPMPLVAIQLLWLNVVTDGIQDFALSFEKADVNTMNEKPRSTKESLFSKGLFQEILVSGFIIGIIVFLVWYYLIKIVKLDISVARGYIMALMVFIQNIHVFNCRSENKSAFSIPLKNNPLIVIGVVFSICLQFIIMGVPSLALFLKTSPINITILIGLFVLSLLVLILMEIYKKIKSFKNN